jgi:hypothetical protein
MGSLKRFLTFLDQRPRRKSARSTVAHQRVLQQSLDKAGNKKKPATPVRVKNPPTAKPKKKLSAA